ncbi:sce7726 family protein [Bacillus cereus]|uniref:sce7726 family protein n=1 Tax=Bacillus cereus TaxID=1396 RepID=UPI000BF422AD|nr:sce7726 family protein [Bacillus cereus]PFB14129.1 hypothetical protein CN408_27765 [Bacillus cereus]
MQEKNYYKYAQLLSTQYSTFLSNEAVKNKVLKTFEGQIPTDQFKNNLTPREFINKFLLQYYPNETTVKATFINNVLFKTNNHVSIFELNVGNSRLDLCKINSTSTAFEIKTELDTPKRLDQQMKDYFKVFEKVYLICSVHNLKSMINHVPNECGIYTYYVTRTGKYVFKKVRSAAKSKYISAFSQLSVLTKRDLKIFFDCPILETKEAMISLIIDNKTKKEINKTFKLCLKNKFHHKWSFLVENSSDILEIDYQWFFKNTLSPKIVYL